mgnify:CR=1 FL=1
MFADCANRCKRAGAGFSLSDDPNAGVEDELDEDDLILMTRARHDESRGATPAPARSPLGDRDGDVQMATFSPSGGAASLNDVKVDMRDAVGSIG